MPDIDSGKCLKAMRFEMDSMSSNKVWTLVDPPKGFKPIGCKRVYKRKLGADGEVTTFKARLVTKGYTQRPSVDFEETYSSIAMAKSIRILLAISAYYDYEIWWMDVKTVFLNDFIEEEIYMDQPVDFISMGEEQKVSGSSDVFLVLYVDDIFLIGNWVFMQFSMKDLSDDSYILGIKIYRDRSRRILGMTRASYIEKVLKRKMCDIPYASAINSIQYVVPCTRPDIAFALSVTSRYQAYAGETHWSAIKTILKYLRMTQEKFLVFGGEKLLNGGVVAWNSSKQDTIVDSTIEAEYIATSEATKEAVWTKNYLQKLDVVPSIVEPIVTFCDNNGAIVQVKEPRSHHKSKHILRRYHLLQEMVGRGDVRVDSVTSAENMADPLTKPIHILPILNI
ncbi:UNVERIFIED_CONTAM: Retrovirus-related Pol polyprotein from transposon RE2 [Sesamum latifolium]|uniref:Retrovirus-related Pol polyprotein from transposon RE2 n=1 Tax=Sesamum latifolium TaxID=2727402 RepID=A0AAW2X2I2_9LAMI